MFSIPSKIRIIVLCLLGLFSIEATAQQDGRWLYIGQDQAGTSTYYVDTWRTTRRGVIIDTWTKTIMTEGYSYTDHFLFNCQTLSDSLVEGRTYSPDGEVIESFGPSSAPSSWRDIIPESIGEVELMQLCSMHLNTRKSRRLKQ